MITIIGAGPSGSYSAYLLAKKGLEVQVFEEHNIIGEPVSSTGIITGLLAKHFKVPEELIVSKPENARIYSPAGDFFEVKLKNDMVLDRARLDRHLAKMAQEAGAKYFLGQRFVDCQREKDKFRIKLFDKATGKIREIVTDQLVGADGPLSRVAKSAGLYGNRVFYTGLQATVDVENDGFIEFYLNGKDIAWLVPENKNTARVGIAASSRADLFFREFLEKRIGKDFETKVLARQSGLIPVYNPKIKTEDRAVYLVGDAATMEKATTLGGINQGMIGAMALAEAISSGKNYDKLWRKKMGKELYLALLIRKAMNKFSDEDYNKLIALMNKHKNKKLLEAYERDAPSKFIFKMAMQEPGLWAFVKYLF
ncbi:MAG: NAD(P)/FAD-dependent oxidoreductase [Candidatus Woesearchaeota archaeon]